MDRGRKRFDRCDDYKTIKWYQVRSDEIEKEIMRYLRVMWYSRPRHEICRDCDLESYVTVCMVMWMKET